MRPTGACRSNRSVPSPIMDSQKYRRQTADTISESGRRVDPINSKLMALCSGLGTKRLKTEKTEGKILKEDNLFESYTINPEALNNLKDLSRILLEDETLHAFQTIGRSQIMKSDLINLIIESLRVNREDILEATLTVMIKLTSIPRCDESELTQEHLDILRVHKKIIISNRITKVIFLKLIELLRKLECLKEIENGEFKTTYDMATTCLTLIANIMVIPNQQYGETNAANVENSYLQEELLIQLQEINAPRMFLCIASSIHEILHRKWCLIVLKFFYGLIMNQDPEAIYDFKNNPQSKISLLLEKEETANNNRCKSTRHPLFGGTLELKLNDGLRFNIHKGTAALTSVRDCFESGKTYKSRKKTQYLAPSELPKKCNVVMSKQIVGIYYSIYVCFLENCFNSFVEYMQKYYQMNNAHLQQYFCLVTFFLKFQKLLSKDGDEYLDTITGFVNLEGLRFIMKNLNQSLDKNNWKDLLVQLECLACFFEILHQMMLCNNPTYADIAEHIVTNMLYDITSIDFISRMSLNIKIKTQAFYKLFIRITHSYLNLLIMISRAKSTVFVGNSEEDDAMKEVRIEKLIARLVTNRVVSIYGAILRYYDSIPERYIYAVLYFFELVHKRYKSGLLIFTLSNLNTFNNILVNESPDMSETHRNLRKFIVEYLSEYFEVASRHPILLLQAMFPKSLGEIELYVNDYKTKSPSKKNKESIKKHRDVPMDEGRSKDQKIEDAVVTLLNAGEIEILSWIVDEFVFIASNILVRENSHNKINKSLEDYSRELKSTDPTKEEIIKNNPRVRQLLECCGFREEGGAHKVFVLSKEVSLDEFMRIQQIIVHPLDNPQNYMDCSF